MEKEEINMKEKLFYYIVIPVIALAVVIGFIVLVSFSAENSAIGKEESIASAKSGISKEEQRRVDLFSNMVDAVQSYNDHEAETLKHVTDARAKAQSGDVEGAKSALNIVVEAYPEIKSQANYSQAMKEFSITENRLAEYRDNYNQSVKTYKRYVRKFPTRLFLSWRGYEVSEYEYLDFKVDNSKATNLFK